MKIKKKIETRSRILLLAGLVALSALGLSSCTTCSGPEKVEKIRIGLLPDSVCALLYIAGEQGFFKRNGLDVSLENYQAGVFAVNGLLEGKADAATATEFVLAIRGFKRQDLRVVAAISSSDSIEVVARNDRGIGKPADLKGKLVGDSRGTATSFYLSSFLSLNNIRSNAIRRIDIKPVEMAAALLDGKVDAAVSFSPHLDKIKKALGSKSISWPAQGGRDFYYLLITKEEFLKTHSGAMTRLLKALIEAEAFLKAHESKAQEAVMKALTIDRDALMSTWSKTRFRVSLDQALVTLMEDEGRWAIKNKLVNTVTIPDYSSILYPEGLRKIKSEAVGLN
jgi:NitT/TauT family transport system substrate-binding protein